MSFWVEPFIESNKEKPIKKIDYFYLCSASSFLSIKKFYGNCHLYTDVKGKEILVDKLGLDFDSVTILDFSGIPKCLWAVSKILAYKMQTEPFIHFDYDILLLKHLGDLSGYDVIVQSKEFIANEYISVNNELIKTYDIENFTAKVNNLPDEWNRDKVYSYNVGVIGINNINLIHDYCDKFMDCLRSNIFEEVSNPLFYIINLEQLLFTLICDDRDMKVKILIDKANHHFANKTNIETYPFLHFQGENKKYPINRVYMMNYIKENNPIIYKNFESIMSGL